MPEVIVNPASLQIEKAGAELPAGFHALCEAANGEGYRHLDRLTADWRAGFRLDRDGEALYAVRVGGELVGIGGLTVDPVIPGTLRMRRFYVRASYRRHGIGHLLAERLLARARPLRQRITVNAAPGSERFWEVLGFVAERRDSHTHVLCSYQSEALP
jgi:GNAT superfamily N-acetyltransferase